MNTSLLLNHPLESSLRAWEIGGSPEKMDAFLDVLLSLTADHKNIACQVVDNQVVRVEYQSGNFCDVPLSRATPKFRAVCARLSVRLREWTGRDISPYGDEVEFEHPQTQQQCIVRFSNTTACQKIEVRRSGGSSNY